MYRESTGVLAGMAVAVALLGAAPQPHSGVASAVTVKLSEWNVVLSQASVAAGPVTFVITNAGSIPHGLEVEGQGIEQEVETIQPGASDTLTTEFDEERHSESVADRHPGAAVEAQSQRAALRRAIDDLPPEFREVIVLRELEGLSYKEISDVAGVPVGTVMSRLSRARRRLEEALCADPEDC